MLTSQYSRGNMSRNFNLNGTLRIQLYYRTSLPLAVSPHIWLRWNAFSWVLDHSDQFLDFWCRYNKKKRTKQKYENSGHSGSGAVSDRGVSTDERHRASSNRTMKKAKFLRKKRAQIDVATHQLPLNFELWGARYVFEYYRNNNNNPIRSCGKSGSRWRFEVRCIWRLRLQNASNLFSRNVWETTLFSCCYVTEMKATVAEIFEGAILLLCRLLSVCSSE